MHCLACDALLTEKEQARKFANHAEIPNPEDRFIGLCDRCFYDGELDDLGIADVESIIGV